MRTLACAALAALMLTLAACGGGVSFDVSAGQPLGSVAQMEDVIKGKERFERSKERKLTRPECFNDLDLIEKLTELKAYQWEEFPASETIKHLIVLAIDDAGEIRAVAGMFRSGSAKFTTNGTRTHEILASYWEAVFGPATFKKQNRPGIDVDEFFLATAAKGGVRGRWEKEPKSGIASNSRSIWDMILIWRE